MKAGGPKELQSKKDSREGVSLSHPSTEPRYHIILLKPLLVSVVFWWGSSSFAVCTGVLNASSGLVRVLATSHCWHGAHTHTHTPNCFFCSYSVWLLLTFTLIIRCYPVLLQRSQCWFYINSLQITHTPHFSEVERGILIFDCINSIVFQMLLKENWNVLEKADPSRRICWGFFSAAEIVLWFPRSETSIAFKDNPHQSYPNKLRLDSKSVELIWLVVHLKRPKKKTQKRDTLHSRMLLSNSWWAAVDRPRRSFSDCSLNLNTPKYHSSAKQDQSYVFGVSDDSVHDGR